MCDIDIINHPSRRIVLWVKRVDSYIMCFQCIIGNTVNIQCILAVALHGLKKYINVIHTVWIFVKLSISLTIIPLRTYTSSLLV